MEKKHLFWDDASEPNLEEAFPILVLVGMPLQKASCNFYMYIHLKYVL